MTHNADNIEITQMGHLVRVILHCANPAAAATLHDELKANHSRLPFELNFRTFTAKSEGVQALRATVSAILELHWPETQLDAIMQAFNNYIEASK